MRGSPSLVKCQPGKFNGVDTTMSANNLLLIATALYSLVGHSVAQAQSDAQSATDEQLLACAAISDAAERTKCFDDIVNNLRQEATTSATDGATPESFSSPSAAPAADAGATAVTATAASEAAESMQPAPGSVGASAAGSAESVQEAAAEVEAPSGASGSVEPPDDAEEFPIYSTIVESNKSGDYHFVVTLENGQVWEETDGSRRIGLPKVGQEVRITKAVLGGRRMKIGNDNRIAWVRRLR